MSGSLRTERVDNGVVVETPTNGFNPELPPFEGPRVIAEGRSPVTDAVLAVVGDA